MIRSMQSEEALSAIETGDFPDSLLKASKAVAVILTQSWCPQWKFVQSYLDSLHQQAGNELSIFWLEYDTAPFFERFMQFKETQLGNDQVPYIRYYVDGVLVAQSNAIARQGFLDSFGIFRKRA